MKRLLPRPILGLYTLFILTIAPHQTISQTNLANKIFKAFPDLEFSFIVTSTQTPLKSNYDFGSSTKEVLSYGNRGFVLGVERENPVHKLLRIKIDGQYGWVSKNDILLNDNSKDLLEIIEIYGQANLGANLLEEENKKMDSLVLNYFKFKKQFLNQQQKEYDSLMSFHESLLINLKRKKEIENQKTNIKKEIDELFLNQGITLKNENKKRKENLKSDIEFLISIAEERNTKTRDSINQIKTQELNLKDSLDREIKIQKIEEQKNQQARSVAKRKLNILNKYGDDIGNLILQGKIRIGMTESMLLESWGDPDRINKTITEWGIRQQFVYSTRDYVYLENGRIVSIQTSH